MAGASRQINICLVRMDIPDNIRNIPLDKEVHTRVEGIFKRVCLETLLYEPVFKRVCLVTSQSGRVVRSFDSDLQGRGFESEEV